jgi:hypothetical protein
MLTVALVPAAWGQLLLMDRRPIGWLGTLLGLALAAVAARFLGPPKTPVISLLSDSRLRRRWWALIPAVTLSGLAWWFQLAPEVSEPRVLVLWALSLGFLLVPYLIPEKWNIAKSRLEFSGWFRRNGLELAAVFLLLAVALTVRLPFLERYPAPVHNDEASCGLMAQQVLERREAGERYWFRRCDGFYYFPSLGFFPSAIAQAATGTSLYGHRLANVLLSMAALGCLYLVARTLCGRTVALVTLGLAATAHTAIHWSRSGIHVGHAAWLTVICAWLAWKAVSSGRLQWFVLLGWSLSACLFTYNAAYLVPLWLALVLGILWLASRNFRKHLTLPLALAALSALVFFAPMLAEYQKNPGTFFERANVMVWTQDPISVGHMRSEFEGDFRRAMVIRNVRRTAGLLHTTGDSNLQYANRGNGVVDGVTAVAFVLGVGVAVAWPTAAGSWPLLLLLALNLLLGAVFPMDGVQYSRIAGLALAIAVVPALWAGQMAKAATAAFGRIGGRLAGVALAGGLVLVAWVNLSFYFGAHDHHHWTIGRLRPVAVRAVLARNIRDWGTENITYVHTSLPTNFEDQAHRLIASDRAVVACESDEELDFLAASDFRWATIVVPADAREMWDRLASRYPFGEELALSIRFRDPSDVARAYRFVVAEAASTEEEP